MTRETPHLEGYMVVWPTFNDVIERRCKTDEEQSLERYPISLLEVHCLDVFLEIMQAPGATLLAAVSAAHVRHELLTLLILIVMFLGCP